MAVPKRKTSKSRKNKRRSHHALALPAQAKCAQCGEPRAAAPRVPLVRLLRRRGAHRDPRGSVGARCSRCSFRGRAPSPSAWAATSPRRRPPRARSSRPPTQSSGLPLSKLCFEGPDDALLPTEIQQPAILATSVALLRALEERVGALAPGLRRRAQPRRVQRARRERGARASRTRCVSCARAAASCATRCRRAPARWRRSSAATAPIVEAACERPAPRPARSSSPPTTTRPRRR